MAMNLKKQQELFDVFVSKMEETLLKKGEDYANTDVCQISNWQGTLLICLKNNNVFLLYQ